jgi:hypothetical protein
MKRDTSPESIANRGLVEDGGGLIPVDEGSCVPPRQPVRHWL